MIVALITEKTKYFTTSLTFLILARVISQLFRLVSRIIIARYSSPEIYGFFSIIWNEVTLLSTIVLIGLGQQLTIDLPRFKGDMKTDLISSSLFYSFTLGILSSIIALLFFIIKEDTTFLYSFFISAIFITFLLMQFVFIGIKDFFGYFILMSSQTTILLIFIFSLRNFLSLVILVIGFFVSLVISSFIAFFYLIRKHKVNWRDLFKIRKSIFKFTKRRISLFSVDIVNSGILYLLVKIPQLMIDVTLSAYISVAFSVMSFIIILPQIISTSMGPLLSENYSQGNFDKLNSNFRTGISLIYVFQSVSIIFFSYFGGWLIELLYGSNYLFHSYLIYSVFLITMIVESFNYPFGIFIRNTGNELKFALGRSLTLVIFIVFEILFVLFFKEKGIGVAFAYYINASVLLVFYMFITIKTNKRYTKNDLRKFILWFIFVEIVAILGIYYSPKIESTLILILVTIVNIIIAGLYLTITKIININSLIKDIRTIIKQKVNNKKNNRRS